MSNPAIAKQLEESPDWEASQTIDALIEMGEGPITDVINVALEKHWLRSNTKLPACFPKRWPPRGWPPARTMLLLLLVATIVTRS